AGRAGRLDEATRLLEAVDPGGRVEDEERLVRRAGHLPGRDPAHLGELVHEVLLRVEPTRRVDEERRGAPGPRGRQRVEEDGRAQGQPAGPAPPRGRTSGTSSRSAQVWSCSIAPARKVPAAARSTGRPAALSRAASFAVVVVFPEPLTPTRNETKSGTSGRAP